MPRKCRSRAVKRHKIRIVSKSCWFRTLGPEPLAQAAGRQTGAAAGREPAGGAYNWRAAHEGPGTGHGRHNGTAQGHHLPDRRQADARSNHGAYPKSRYLRPTCAIRTPLESLRPNYAKLMRQSVRLVACCSFIVITAAYCSVPSHAENPDDALRVYAVKVLRTPAQSKKPLVSSGIYLGQGAVITVAHVVGPNPRALIAGQNLAVNVIKKNYETTDLALLTVDKTRLPVSLLLRRNPLCKEPPKIGETVVVVVTGGTIRSRIISRSGINSFISDVSTIGDSGSGIFDAQKKCLLGILKAKISEFYYLMRDGNMVIDLGRGSKAAAKEFVPASEIVDFIPLEFRY